jgi:hypothetical protein
MPHMVHVPACPVSIVTLSVDSVLQCLTCFEAGDLGGADFNRCTSLGIATGTGSAILDCKSTKTNQDNRITLFQSASDGLDDGVQSTTGSSFRKIGRCSDGINQFRLVHSKSPYMSQ